MIKLDASERSDGRIVAIFNGNESEPMWTLEEAVIDVMVRSLINKSIDRLPKKPRGTLSVEQLLEIKRETYQYGVDNRYFDKARYIWEQIGETKPGRLARVVEDPSSLTIKIAGRLRVEFAGKVVADEFAGNEDKCGIFVFGTWIMHLERLYVKARETELRKLADAEEAKRQRLMDELHL